ncbi:YitT family protein [Defluviitalea phaphyphila]|uniref:YitT family protein n=1 Tax=Defluviitalea phaphyphila TaxID=1473580 RepID=UPI000730817D|nr:YitT family protein [Defluviitalea phaphyphila]
MLNIFSYIKNVIFIFIGAFIMSISINGILIPNHILSGGVTGVAMLLHILFNWNISLLIMFINIPIFILGYKFINKRFTFLSLIGMFSLTISLYFSQNFKIPTQDILVSVLLGGTISGLGMGIVFRGSGSTGGTDIIVKILNKFLSFNMGSISFALNMIIITLSSFFFGIDLSIYTLATMFVASQTTNYVVDGLNYKRTISIITDKHEEISQRILREAKRGVTLMHGEGGYTKAPKTIITCTVGIRQVSKIKEIVKQTDPKAFMTISETAQVFGSGFVGFNKID